MRHITGDAPSYCNAQTVVRLALGVPRTWVDQEGSRWNELHIEGGVRLRVMGEWKGRYCRVEGHGRGLVPNVGLRRDVSHVVPISCVRAWMSARGRYHGRTDGRYCPVHRHRPASVSCRNGEVQRRAAVSIPGRAKARTIGIRLISLVEQQTDSMRETI
nr:hypothetical protein CFP56_11889 [Quercus suber]